MKLSLIHFRLLDYFWPFGASMLCGLGVLYLTTLGLFALGIPITPWHGLVFPAAAGLTSFFALSGQITKRCRSATGILLVQLVLCGVLTGIASRLDELSVDGMRLRIEPVINLMAGWNLIKDPEFSDRATLEEKYPFLKGGNNYQASAGTILAGYLACLTGEVNAGKAITPILGLAAFGIAFGGLSGLVLPAGWAVALAILAAMNPVLIYQSSSYYIDGHVAALFTTTLFTGLRLLISRRDLSGIAAFFISLVLLGTAKTSGIFYGGILFFLVGLIWVFQHPKKILALGLLGCIFLGTSAILISLRQQGGFAKISTNYLLSAMAFDEGNNEHSFRKWVPGLAADDKPNRIQVFFRSHFAPTAVLAEKKVFIKFPFWFSRPELAIYEDLSPQPYVGGFGPLYGAFFVLSALSLLLLRSRPPPASWLPLISSVTTVYFSQLWWARWTPQAWLIPFGILLPVICSLQGMPSGKKWILPLLALFAGLLNSVLILAFYTSGCIQTHKTLESQLAYLKTLPKPLSVYMPDYPSNRILFIRDNMAFENIPQAPPRPRLKLHRTSTLVALPSGADPQTEVGPFVWANWKKRKLIEP